MKYRVLQGVMIDATDYNPGAEVDLDENRADVKSLLSNGKLQQVDGQHDNEGLRRTTTESKPVAPMTTENSDSLAPGKDYQV